MPFSSRPTTISVFRSALLLCIAGALMSPLILGCRVEPRSSSSSVPVGPEWFHDITEEGGIAFVHDAGPLGDFPLPQIMGSGVALFDYDNDGRLDLYFIQNGGPKSGSTNRLYHQEADGRFRDVSAGSGLDIAGWGMGVAIGDVNNDGLPDVLVTGYGATRLFLNQGNGTFREVTEAAGVDSPLWSTAASFVDFDRDGWLDLVLVHYVDYSPDKLCTDSGGRADYCSPSAFRGSVTKLFRNRGHVANPSIPVQFEDVTVRSGLARLPGPGLGVWCADFDGDHWPDIFVANDSQPNHLWINNRNGTFREEAVVRGVAFNQLGRTEANMGIAVGDLRGFGRFDFLVTHLTEETHTLWVQRQAGVFQDGTAAAGLTSPAWRATGFGAVFADFDLDGQLDLAIVNGRVSRLKSATPDSGLLHDLGPHWANYAERNQLFAGEPGGRFREVSMANPAFCGRAGVARALAVGDLDNDGAPDLVVTYAAGAARLFHNVAPRQGHWLRLRAIDPALHRDTYGAEIRLIAGNRTFTAWINPSSSYLSSHDPRAAVGLGNIEQIDHIDVTWPAGQVERFPGGAVDRELSLRKGTGQAISMPASPEGNRQP